MAYCIVLYGVLKEPSPVLSLPDGPVNNFILLVAEPVVIDLFKLDIQRNLIE